MLHCRPSPKGERRGNPADCERLQATRPSALLLSPETLASSVSSSPSSTMFRSLARVAVRPTAFVAPRQSIAALKPTFGPFLPSFLFLLPACSGLNNPLRSRVKQASGSRPTRAKPTTSSTTGTRSSSTMPLTSLRFRYVSSSSSLSALLLATLWPVKRESRSKRRATSASGGGE